MSSVYLRSAGIACAVLILAGCAARKPATITEAQPAEPPKPVACVPAKAGDPMIGTWLSNSRPRDVSGDLQSLLVLSADGTMAYESAADEVIFIVGPVLVGVLATLFDPTAPVLLAAALSALAVSAFAVHPSAAVTGGRRPGSAPSREARVARPEEIAFQILACAANPYMTGSIVDVDGGLATTG